MVVKAMGEEQWEAVGETLGAEGVMGGTPNNGGGEERNTEHWGRQWERSLGIQRVRERPWGGEWQT